MRGHDPDVEPRPRGLLGLWDVRRSFVHRFELLRLKRARGAWKRRAGTRAAAAVHALSAILIVRAVTKEDGADLETLFGLVAVISYVLLFALPLAVLAGSPAAGGRAFAGERANATLDALMMAPIPRYELVAARFLAQLRAHLFLFAVFAASFAGLLLALSAHDPPPAEAVRYIWAAWGTAVFYYFSTLMFGAALGFYFGLRMTSAAAALAASIAAFLALGAVEVFGYFFTIGVLGPLLAPFGPYGFRWTIFVAILYGIPLVLAAVHVLGASSLVSRAAQRFDAWGRGRWG